MNNNLHKKIIRIKRPLDCVRKVFRGEKGISDVIKGLISRKRKEGWIRFIWKGIRFVACGVLSLFPYIFYKAYLFIKNHWQTIIVLFVLLIWLSIPFFLDRYFNILLKIYQRVFGRNIRFENETWFTVIATFAASVPGAMCGALAIIQTRRIHEIEDRSHRPVLRLEDTFLRIAWINKVEIEPQFYTDQYYAICRSWNGGNKGRITWNMKVSCRGDVDAQRISVRSVDFRLKRHVFHFILDDKEQDSSVKRVSNRIISDGVVMYDMECDLFPCSLDDWELSIEDFWKDVRSVVNGSTQGNKIEAAICMDVYHENVRRGKQPVKLTVIWRRHIQCQLSQEEKQYIRRVDEYHSGEGYFSYNMK